jgi:hypothetical protein
MRGSHRRRGKAGLSAFLYALVTSQLPPVGLIHSRGRAFAGARLPHVSRKCSRAREAGAERLGDSASDFAAQAEIMSPAIAVAPVSATVAAEIVVAESTEQAVACRIAMQQV